jgi:hypothetical protein
MQSLFTQSGFSIVGFTEHHFELQGYTAIWLLAESGGGSHFSRGGEDLSPTQQL